MFRSSAPAARDHYRPRPEPGRGSAGCRYPAWTWAGHGPASPARRPAPGEER